MSPLKFRHRAAIFWWPTNTQDLKSQLQFRLQSSWLPCLKCYTAKIPEHTDLTEQCDLLPAYTGTQAHNQRELISVNFMCCVTFLSWHLKDNVHVLVSTPHTCSEGCKYHTVLRRILSMCAVRTSLRRITYRLHTPTDANLLCWQLLAYIPRWCQHCSTRRYVPLHVATYWYCTIDNDALPFFVLFQNYYNSVPTSRQRTILKNLYLFYLFTQIKTYTPWGWPTGKGRNMSQSWCFKRKNVIPRYSASVGILLHCTVQHVVTNRTNQKAPFRTALRYLNAQCCYYPERWIRFKWVIHDDDKCSCNSAAVTGTNNWWTSSAISTLYI